MPALQEKKKVATGHRWLRGAALYGMVLILLGICQFSWPSDEAANVKTASEEKWRVTHSFYAGPVAPEGEETVPLLDLAVDSQGLAYMGFCDQGADLSRYWYQRSVRQWRKGLFGELSLEDELGKGAKVESDGCGSILIRLDQRDRPHILWSRSELHYMTPKGKDPEKDGWIHSVVPQDGDKVKALPRFALGSDGTPYVLYLSIKKTGRFVNLATMQEGKWKIESLEIKITPYCDITVGNNDEVIVALCYRSHYPDEDHRLVLLTKSEDKWVQEEIATLDFLTNLPTYYINVLVDLEGNPHVFYPNRWEEYREDDVIYEELARRENKWQRQGVISLRPGMWPPFPEAVSVDISPDGKVFVCYADMESGLYLVEEKGGKWQEHLLDTTKGIIKTSLAAISSSEVAVAFLSKSKEKPGLFQMNFKRVKPE